MYGIVIKRPNAQTHSLFIFKNKTKAIFCLNACSKIMNIDTIYNKFESCSRFVNHIIKEDVDYKELIIEENDISKFYSCTTAGKNETVQILNEKNIITF